MWELCYLFVKIQEGCLYRRRQDLRDGKGNCENASLVETSTCSLITLLGYILLFTQSNAVCYFGSVVCVIS